MSNWGSWEYNKKPPFEERRMRLKILDTCVKVLMYTQCTVLFWAFIVPPEEKEFVKKVLKSKVMKLAKQKHKEVSSTSSKDNPSVNTTSGIEE